MSYKIDSKGRECSGCNKYKLFSEFYKDKSSTTGYVAMCRPCSATKRNGNYKISKSGKSQKCSSCNITKPITEFKKHRVDFGGGHYSICFECSGQGASIPDSIASAPIDIDFLLDVKRVSKNGWSLEQAKFLLVKIKEAHENNQMNALDSIYGKYGSGKSKSGCVALIKEIKQLAQQNKTSKNPLSLEDYWKAGRPLRHGAKVLVNGKK